MEFELLIFCHWLHDMENALTTYLHDHLGGSAFAIELLERIQAEYSNSEGGRIAREILPEIEEDRRILQEIVSKVGSFTFDIHDAIGWLAERASRVKLKRAEPEGIGVFEAFETLGLGILGKRCLWEVLSLHAKTDVRLKGPYYPFLIERAQQQFLRVNQYRLKLAQTAFAEAKSGTARGKH